MPTRSGPSESNGRKPLHVVLVSSSSGSRGGGEFYFCGLASGLTALGHRVTSVLSSHSRMDELDSLLKSYGPVHRLSFQNTYDRRLRNFGTLLSAGNKQITQELAALRPDVIHVNKQNLEDGLDLLVSATKTGIPTVATVHVTRTMRQLGAVAGQARDWISFRILRRLRCPLIAIAGSGVVDLSRIGIKQNRLHVVLNGVSGAQPGDREAVRNSWGCRPDHQVLGCIARIESQKNPLFIPPLLAQLPANVRVVWIGDGSLSESMRRRAEELGVADRLVLPGWQHNARSFLSGFDAFILPSLYEGFPFAILEAMAAGLPCVVSHVDGVAEAVVDGDTGFVCPVNDTETWLARLRSVLDDPGLRTKMGASALARYQENFSLEVMASKTVAVYRNVIASSSVGNGDLVRQA